MAPPAEPADHGNDDSSRESSPYVKLDRSTWALLAAETKSPLTGDEIHRLRGIGDSLDLREVEDVYLPLSRLLSLRVRAAAPLHRAQEEFLHGRTPPRTPFVIGLAGSVAVGKSTAARVLQQMLARWPEHPNVALVTTDTFRVGAHDQLRSLGRILNVPVRVVDKERSMASVIASLRDFPLVLVDTAGFRHGDPLLRDQLQMLDGCPSVERVLVMACNSQLQSLKASMHAYASGHLVGCVLTKLDETASLGEALSVVLRQGLAVAYTTDGQDIPKDIAIANGHALVARAVALLKAQRADRNFGKAL